MPLITIPQGVSVKRVGDWQRNDPAQVNRSEWTGKRQATILPTAPRWSGKFEFVPLIGDANVRQLRSMLSRMRGPAYPLKVPATEAAQMTTQILPVLAPDGLVNRGNTNVSGRTVSKSGGVDGNWDAAAYSTTRTGGLVVSFRTATPGASFMAGLADTLTDNSYEEIDYAWYPAGDGVLRIIESGVSVDGFKGFTSDEILSIVYDGASVWYFRDGYVVRKVAAGGGRTFRCKASFAHLGATAADLTATAVPTSYTPSVVGLAPNQAAAIADGMMGTLLLLGGGAQLVTFEAEVASDGAGAGITVPVFWPYARKVPYAIAAGKPFAHLANKVTAAGYSIDPGQIYGGTLDLEEV